MWYAVVFRILRLNILCRPICGTDLSDMIIDCSVQLGAALSVNDSQSY